MNQPAATLKTCNQIPKMQQKNSMVTRTTSSRSDVIAGTNSDQSSFHHRNGIPTDVLMEVLSWLPGKSLMRFKSVSKHFLYLITQPLFIEMYHTRSYARKGDVVLLVSPRPYYRSYTWDRSFFVINMMEDMSQESARVSIHKPSPNSLNKSTNIVNGLICLYHQQYNRKSRFYLYNLTTRVILRLPKSTRIRIFKETHCFLGFDPTNKEYKVLRFAKVGNNNNHSVERICEVVTVGSEDKQCRPIDIPAYLDSGALGLSWVFCEEAICCDGVLYWTSHDRILNKTALIHVFNVEHEKLEYIKCPTTMETGGAVLAHIQGNITLVQIRFPHCNDSSNHITLWTLMDGSDKDNPLWTEKVTICQFPGGGPRMFGCSSSGLIFSPRPPYSDQCIVDCFNLESDQYKEVTVNNDEGIIVAQHYEFRLTLLVANIVSLKNLNTHMILSK